jgi:Restriction endonuclease
MANPSSQVAAVWVQQELKSTSWVLLKDVLFNAVRQKLVSISEEDVWEYVETNLPYVAEHLRDIIADREVDGAIPTFEIDNDPSPYIRLSASLPSDVISKLRKIDPFQLEDVCAKLLCALGATSYATQRTNDGGVDFIAVKLKVVPLALTVPAACTAAVIGQAKRYKDGNSISETRLREFVGAATLKRHQLTVENKVGPLAPVLFAFWTTSDFDQNAKRYARDLGLWYMDGSTLSNYVVALGLKDAVMSLPDVSTCLAKPGRAAEKAEALIVSTDSTD